MKKKGSQIIKFLKNVINIKYWLDLERLKGVTIYLARGIKNMFVPRPQANGERFQDAVKALNLTQEDLEKKRKGLYYLSILMLFFAILIFSYGIYQLFHGAYLATSLSLVVMLIALVLAFRYHFWYFQITKQKLGCTIREWYKQGLLGEKK